MMNSRKSRAKIIIIKTPLVAAVGDPETVETISEEVLNDYRELQEKCESILERIKRRKNNKPN